MTLAPDEFIRRFLLHVLPGGFHRIRHYGLIANAERRDSLAIARRLLGSEPPEVDTGSEAPDQPLVPAAPTFVCPDCGAAMIVVDTVLRRPRILDPPRRLAP